MSVSCVVRKKICFVTAARSEYGALKWIMRELYDSDYFECQLVVTGGHLLKNQGYTLNQILEDGFVPDIILDCNLDVTTKKAIAIYMGRLLEKISDVYESIKPDYIFVAGDRYELLPICEAAFIMEIPIIHISGGDITRGAIDNGIRNAVSMMASYHFPGTEESESNLKKMLDNSDKVWRVGEPCLDDFTREKLYSRNELADMFSLNTNARWIMFTYHAETLSDISDDLSTVRDCLDILYEETDFFIIATYSNADFGGNVINNYLNEFAESHSSRICVIPSLGHLRYLSMLGQINMVIGNSSSGIIEAPFMKVPVVNIGNRQSGRHICDNIVCCKKNRGAIREAILHARSKSVGEKMDRFYWGDGKSSKRIRQILEKELFV